MQKIYFEVKSNNQQIVRLDLRKSNYQTKVPINIFLHGFKAFRNWGFIPYLSEKLAKNVGITINIDFSLNGISDEQNMLYDIDIFRKNTVSQELDDINKLLDAIKDGYFNKEIESIWNGEINLIGHSLGGAVSIITAFERNDINKIVLWSSISKLDRNTERQKAQWREKTYLEFTENRSGQTLILDVEYLEDKERNTERFNLRKIISELTNPICIIQGKLDFVTKLSEAETLEKLAVKSSDLETLYIEKGNHTFGAYHPFLQTNDVLEMSISKTIEFLNK